MNIRIGDLVIVDNILYELIAIDFGVVAVLKQYYDEGEVILRDMELSIVQVNYDNMLNRGVDKTKILGWD